MKQTAAQIDETTAGSLKDAYERREAAEAEYAAAQRELRGAVKVAGMRYTQHAIAETLGLSRQRVAQLLRSQDHD